jgi:uncharacterized protein (TIGR03437 family)
MMRVYLIIAALCSQLAVQAAGVTVQFQPGSAQTGPFPSDSLTVPDPAQLTGVRVNLPQPDCITQPASCRELAEINQLDGFNLAPRLAVRFSGPVNTATLREGVFVTWLDRVTGGEAGLQPRGHITRINRPVFDALTNTLYAEPDEPLDQQRRYLLIVTDAVRDASGDPVSADPSFGNCIGVPGPNDYCSALGTALRSVTVPGRVVAASRFTTLSATAFLERARAAIQGSPTEFHRLEGRNVFRPSEIVSVVLRLQVGMNPARFEDFTLPAPGIVLQNVGRIAFASFRSPSFLSAAQAIATQPSGNTVALPAASTEIQFHAFLPSGARPSSGYPVIIAGHGINDSRFGAPTLMAGRFAQDGFATIAMNAVGHGSGPESTVRILDTSFRTTVLPAGGRSIDLDGNGSIDSREGCVITSPIPIGVRDCIRQTVLDLAQLVRVIRSGVDLDGDGAVDLDPNRIYYAGQSLGAIYGTVFHAIEPQIRAAALNVGGGSVIDIARLSPSFRFLLRDYLGTRVPPLLDSTGDFEDNLPLRDQPVRINQTARVSDIQQLLEYLEWLQMRGDPLAYAPHIRSSPLAGATARPALWQLARGDGTMPNPTSTNLIRWAGMRDMSTLYRHDVARAADPLLSDNPHAFLVDFRSLAGIGIGLAAQAQIAQFFASDGSSVPQPGPVLGLNLFITPAPVLEDLGLSGGPLLVTSVSAASYDRVLAAGAIASAFGSELATASRAATSVPLPTALAGTTVRITDSTGTSRLAELYAVTRGQVNYVVPDGTASGVAEVVITNGDGVVSTGTISVERVAPAIFTADQSGRGAPAALVIRRRSNGSLEITNAFRCDTGGCAPSRIDLGLPEEQVYLVLFGTGLRGRTSLAAVTARVGAIPIEVQYAGPQSEYPGVDQVNLLLPRALAGRGTVELIISADGRASNPVMIDVR